MKIKTGKKTQEPDTLDALIFSLNLLPKKI